MALAAGFSVMTAPGPRRRRLAIIATLAVGALSVAFIVAWQTSRTELPTPPEQAAHASSLASGVVPVVAELGVEYWRDRAGCAVLTYRRGDFIDGSPTCCGGTTGTPAQFDEIARADHARIRAALDASGTPVERIGASFYSDGRIRAAWFGSSHGAPFATTWELEYAADTRRALGVDGQVKRTAVPGADLWSFACCAD